LSSKSPKDQVYLGAYGLCFDQDGRLLLTRVLGGPDAGKWTLPGGGVRWGEDPEQAVRREMEEETGLVNLSLKSIAAIYSQTYENNIQKSLPPLHHIGIIYHLETTSYQLNFEQGGTTDICQWLTEREARRQPQTPLGDFGVNLAWPTSSK